MADTKIHILTSRSVSLLIAVLLSVVPAIAQPRLDEPEMYVGAYGGATASTVFFSPSVPGMSDLLKVPIGWNAGLMFRYGGHKVCAVQVEAGYVQRGWREYSATGGYDYTRTLHYIQVPVLAHIHFGGEHAQGFVNIGPDIAYCIQSGQVQESGVKQTTSTYQYRAIDHPFDWGVCGGIGFYGKHRRVGVFQLEVRVHYSFGSLYNNSRVEHFANSNTLTASLNLAYLWQVR